MSRLSDRVAVTVAAACLAIAGCGDGSNSPSSAQAPPPGGVFERYLAEHPAAALDLTHTAVLDLEAGGGGAFDTGEDEGSDAVPYVFRSRTELTLAVAENLAEPPVLVLRNGAGIDIARVDAARRTQTITASGAYTLIVRHPHAGEPGAESMIVFLRPDVARGETGVGANPKDVATVEAGMDCVKCDLRGIALQGSPDSQLLIPSPGQKMRLDLSDFTGATIQYVDFWGTQMIGTVFDGVRFLGVNFLQNSLITASFKDAVFLRRPECQNQPACGRNKDGTNTYANCCERPTCVTSGPVSPLSQPCLTTPLIPATGSLDGVDFSGAMLSGVFLTASELRGAVFTGATFDDTSTVARSDFAQADLRGAHFAGTDVRGNVRSDFDIPGPFNGARFVAATLSDGAATVRFEDVDLRGDVDLEGVSLRGASLVGTILDEQTNVAGADLSGVDFNRADLTRADLSSARLSGDTKFVGATLSDGVAHGVRLACLRASGGHDTGGCDLGSKTTQFKGANLSFVDLSGAGLNEADLGGATLYNARLIGANLNYANLKDAKLIGAQLGVQPGSGVAAAQLGGAFMIDVDLTDADLRSVDLTGAHLYGSSLLVRTRLDSANFAKAICAGAAFSGTLTNAVFNDAVLVNATFNGAVLTNAKFDTAYLEGADFSTASAVAGVTLRNASVSTMPGTWTFMEQDGKPYVFNYDATKLGALASSSNVTCPNNQPGPCTMDKLTPVTSGPYPPQPPCIPDRRFCYENCLTPPTFNHTPPCVSFATSTPAAARQRTDTTNAGGPAVTAVRADAPTPLVGRSPTPSVTPSPSA